MKKRENINHYLLGFTDGEGCFSVSLKHEKTTRFGWALDPVFQITQHKINKNILEMFQKTLRCGRIIHKSGQPDILLFLVDNRRQLVEKVIPFFKRYPLIAKKNDFQKFKEIVIGLENKMHFKPETFKILIKKAFEMNLGGKQRRYSLETVLKEIVGSPETVR